MRKFYLRNLIAGIGFILVLSSAIMSASGPGAGYTNAPSESNCTSCHGGSVITSGTGNLNRLRLNGNFQGGGYVPDSTYTIEITMKVPGRNKYGLQVTALDNSNSPAGNITNLNSRTSRVTGIVGGKTRQYIQHTSTGTSNVGTDSTRWTFEWDAPSANIGTVSFHVIVMAANANSTNDAGDSVYNKIFKISPSSLLPKAIATSNDTITCSGYTVQLNGSGTNSPTSYSWNTGVGGSPSNSTSQNPTVTYASGGIKIVTLSVKNALGVSSLDTLKIDVKASPSAIISIPPSVSSVTSASICEGDSLKISASSGASLSYLWTPNNKTTKEIFVKDAGTYQVKVTSNTNQCSRTSSVFTLNYYTKPVINSVTRKSLTDSFCGSFIDTFTVSGSNIDSIYWYVNNVLSVRTKSPVFIYSGSSTANVYAVAKSTNGCKSAPSAIQKLIRVNKLNARNVLSSKTTSTIDLTWKKPAGINKFEYSVNGSAYNNTSSDTTLSLSSLQPNTNYDITIRSFQNAPCKVSDTSIVVKTNACSNLAYTIDFNARTCSGNSLTAKINKLYGAKYSTSFNGQAFSQDTIFTFSPTSSDTLTIVIVDSLSPTCDPIVEKLAYIIDNQIDNDTSTVPQNVVSCNNTYTMTLPVGYDTYEYYKNNSFVTVGNFFSYQFTGLNDGDKLTARGTINFCKKDYPGVVFNLNPAPVATYTYSRNWKLYTFAADNSGNASYLWKTGTGVVLGNSASFSRDMSDFDNSTINVILTTVSAQNCKDSSTQSITIPNLTDIKSFENQNFKVYPNPFSNQLSIENYSGTFEVNVVDHIGRNIMSAVSDQTLLLIPTETWGKGVYHLMIRDKDGVVSSFTFIKS